MPLFPLPIDLAGVSAGDATGTVRATPVRSPSPRRIFGAGVRESGGLVGPMRVRLGYSSPLLSPRRSLDLSESSPPSPRASIPPSPRVRVRVLPSLGTRTPSPSPSISVSPGQRLERRLPSLASSASPVLPKGASPSPVLPRGASPISPATADIMWHDDSFATAPPVTPPILSYESPDAVPERSPSIYSPHNRVRRLPSLTSSRKPERSVSPRVHRPLPPVQPSLPRAPARRRAPSPRRTSDASFGSHPQSPRLLLQEPAADPPASPMSPRTILHSVPHFPLDLASIPVDLELETGPGSYAVEAVPQTVIAHAMPETINPYDFPETVDPYAGDDYLLHPSDRPDRKSVV